MADTITANLGLQLPQIYPGDQWGNKLNSNFAAIDVFAGGSTELTGPRTFGTAAQVLADVALTYTAGTVLTVLPGQYLLTESEGLSYKVAASTATDQHVSTAGGVKLYVQAGAAGYNVKAFGAVGDGAADDTVAIQVAINQSIRNGHALFVPKGTYIVKPATGTNINTGTASQIRLDFLTADGQGLTMYGEGRGKSIIKEADGETAIGGRYTRMFICLMSATTYKLGSFTFKDLTFDKNGASNGLAPSAYAWESAHVIAFSGNIGAPSLDGLTFERIEIRDKVAAGIVAGPSDVDMQSIVISDFLSHDFAGLDAGYYSEKGCIEIANDVENGVIENVVCRYSQIETTAAYSTTRVRRYKIADSKIDTFEFTDSGVLAGNITGTFVDISGLYSKTKFLVRGPTVSCVNSRLKHFSEHFFINSRFTNCEWLLPYDPATFIVTSWYTNTPSSWEAVGLASTSTLVNCTFTIDSASVNAATTGVAVRAVRIGTGQYSPRTTMVGCTFDSRLYGILDGYTHGGHWTLIGCKLSGHNTAIRAGASGSIDASVILNDCDFSAVTGVHLSMISSTAYTLKVTGTYKSSEWQETYTGAGAGGANQAYYIGKPTLMGSAAPASGTWTLGSKVYNDTPTAGGVSGWVCTTAGTPGTWKTFGAIAA